ncbi:hypothetical protein [Streptomyces hirsutus]|uniref:hypothetical protein n=1 Tax=Streptomyces hirsutus TaxID=35620 RepID=UPI0033B1EBE8
MPSAAVLSAVEFDTQLTPPGKAVGQGDEAAFVTVDPNVRPQPPGVADTWMVVCVGQLRQARETAGAAGRECGVDDVDPPRGPGKVAQEVSGQRLAETVRALGVYGLVGHGGRDDGMTGEGHRAFEPPRQGRQHRHPAVDRREAAIGGVHEESQERVRFTHEGPPAC